MTDSLRLAPEALATLAERVHAVVTAPAAPSPLSGPNAWDVSFRALKPGGYLACLCARGDATAHTIAHRLSGFEVRDVVEIFSTPTRFAVVLVRKPFEVHGTVAGNVQKHGCGAMNIDATRIGTEDALGGGAYGDDERERGTQPTLAGGDLKRGIGAFKQPQGRWPANVFFDATMGAALDANAEGASRFFFRVDAPAALLRYLLRLVAPPGSIVLDPTPGGLSAEVEAAALTEGLAFVGVAS